MARELFGRMSLASEELFGHESSSDVTHASRGPLVLVTGQVNGCVCHSTDPGITLESLRRGPDSADSTDTPRECRRLPRRGRVAAAAADAADDMWHPEVRSQQRALSEHPDPEGREGERVEGAMAGNDLCVAAIGSAEQVQANGLDDQPKEKLGLGRPRKDAALTLEQRKHRRMISKRATTKRAYYRRLEKMESLQKENDFLRSLLLSVQKEKDLLAEVLAKRQQRQHKLEALIQKLGLQIQKLYNRYKTSILPQPSAILLQASSSQQSLMEQHELLRRQQADLARQHKQERERMQQLHLEQKQELLKELARRQQWSYALSSWQHGQTLAQQQAQAHAWAQVATQVAQMFLPPNPALMSFASVSDVAMGGHGHTLGGFGFNSGSSSAGSQGGD